MSAVKLPNVGRPGFPSLAVLLGSRLGGAAATELWARLENDEAPPLIKAKLEGSKWRELTVSKTVVRRRGQTE